MASAHDGDRNGPGSPGFGDDWDTVELDDEFVNAAELVEATADERIRLLRQAELDHRVVEAMDEAEAEIALAERSRRRSHIVRAVAAATAGAMVVTLIASSFVAW